MNFFSVISAGLTLAQILLQIAENQEAPVLLDYDEHSGPNLDPWRWRQPEGEVGIGSRGDRGLRIWDTETASHLSFPKRFVLAEVLIQLLGYGFLGLTLFLALGTLSDPQDWPVKLVGLGLFGAIALFCVRCSSQVAQIDLSADRADFVVNYGFFFQRRYRIRPHRRLRFRQMRQTWLSRDLRKNQPYCEVVVGFPLGRITSIDRKFSLACTLAQGSWIVGGLNHWNGVACGGRRA